MGAGTRASQRQRIWLLLGVLAFLVPAALLLRRPLDRPIPYRITPVDPRFGVDQAAFTEAVERAAGLWNTAAQRALFREVREGGMEIRLVYDHRQEVTDRLRATGLKLDGTRASYEELRERHAQLTAALVRAQEALREAQEGHRQRVAAFNAAAERARQEGLASEAERRRLVQEQAELTARQTELRDQEADLNGKVAEVNAVVEALNQAAAAHNLEVVQMQGARAELGPEFGKGLYHEEGRTRMITIYQATSPDDLVRVLAHELGHALGLEHVEDPQAVMHARMQSDRPELAPADVAALQRLRSRGR